MLVVEEICHLKCFLLLFVFKPALPLEVEEVVVMKAAALLHEALRVRLLPRGDVTTLTTLYSVCSLWWKILTYRAYNRRKLRFMLTEKVDSVSKS